MNKLSRNRARGAAVQMPRDTKSETLMSPRLQSYAFVLIAGVGSLLAQAQEFPSPPGEPQPPVAASPPARGAPSSVVYVYPNDGQSEAQSDRDRYECHLWAVRETGFDPSQPQLAPHQRVQVVAGAPPGARTAAGAMTGAVVGAAVARPGNTGEGAVIGAVLGGVVGGAADAAHAQDVYQVQTRESERDAERTARLEEQSSNYRRAISACLQGRGYSVS
jgi:hypothetical protein